MLACQLTLNWTERAQFLAQIMAYLYSLSFYPEKLKETERLDAITGIGMHLLSQIGPKVSLPLDLDEVDSLTEMFDTLQHHHAALPPTEYSSLLLLDLAACCALLERAKRYASTATKGRSRMQEQESSTTASDIVVFCHPHIAADIAEAYESEIEGAQGALPMRVSFVGASEKRKQGIIVLEWQGPITAYFLHNLDIDPDILDYYIHPTRSETAQSNSEQLHAPEKMEEDGQQKAD